MRFAYLGLLRDDRAILYLLEEAGDGERKCLCIGAPMRMNLALAGRGFSRSLTFELSKGLGVIRGQSKNFQVSAPSKRRT